MPRLALFGATLLAFGSFACRSGSVPAPALSTSPALAPEVTPGVASPGQWLFRAELAGEEGSASLKLLLRRWGSDRFTLQLSDSAGGARGELRREGAEALWFDPRQGTFCRLDAYEPIRGSWPLPPFAVADLAALLIGEWPRPEVVVKGPGERASGTRPFTAVPAGEREGPGLWRRWTLWKGGEPSAWFERQGVESLLSLRSPAVQMRWRLTATASLPAGEAEEAGSAGAHSLLTPPGGAEERSCPGNEIL